MIYSANFRYLRKCKISHSVYCANIIKGNRKIAKEYSLATVNILVHCEGIHKCFSQFKRLLMDSTSAGEMPFMKVMPNVKQFPWIKASDNDTCGIGAPIIFQTTDFKQVFQGQVALRVHESHTSHT